jgi:hypothetical protein
MSPELHTWGKREVGTPGVKRDGKECKNPNCGAVCLKDTAPCPECEAESCPRQAFNPPMRYV